MRLTPERELQITEGIGQDYRVQELLAEIHVLRAENSKLVNDLLKEISNQIETIKIYQKQSELLGG